MAKLKSSKRAKAKPAKAPSSSSLTIDDLPNEVVPTILRNLSPIQQLDCMNLTEGFYLASLENLKNSTFRQDVLEAACRKESLSAVKAILEKPEARNIFTNNLYCHLKVLETAGETGNLPLCQFLVDVLDPNQGSLRFQRGFRGAASKCHENVALYFLSKGAILTDDSTFPLLYNAAANNDMKLLEFLLGLKKGDATLDASHNSDYPMGIAVSRAIANNHAQMVQYLLDHRSQLNKKITVTPQDLMSAKTEEMTRILLSTSPDLSAQQNGTGRNVLHWAAHNDNILLAEEGLKVLKERGTSMDVQDTYGDSPLQYAVKCNSLAMVKFLADNGANMNLLDRKEKVPPVLTALPSLEMMKVLVQCGADLHFVDLKQGSVLHALCIAVNRMNSRGNLSAQPGDIDEILTTIINARVPLSATATSHERKTALHLAAEFGQTAIVKRLIEAGADINAQTTRCCTPLHYAASKNKYDCVEALLEAEAVTRIRTVKGKLAKELASAKGKKIFERVEKERELKAQAELEAAQEEAEEEAEKESKKSKRRSKKKKT